MHGQVGPRHRAECCLCFQILQCRRLVPSPLINVLSLLLVCRHGLSDICLTRCVTLQYYFVSSLGLSSCGCRELFPLAGALPFALPLLLGGRLAGCAAF